MSALARFMKFPFGKRAGHGHATKLAAWWRWDERLPASPLDANRRNGIVNAANM